MSILEEVKAAIPNLTWERNGKTIKFTVNGVEKKSDVVAGMLEAFGCSVNVAELKSAILGNETSEDSGEPMLVELPLLEADNDAKSDLTDADDLIWADLKFVKDDTSIFYIKDGDSVNTYTAYLSAASTSDKSDIKTLKEAYFGHTSNRPEQIVKALLKSMNINIATFDSIKRQLPVTAWKYLRIKAYKKKDSTVWDKLVVPRDSADKLYQGVIDFEADFRTSGKHDIETPVPLTNDPNEIAVAYIDLESLSKQYAGKTSKLWDEFLLQRLHKPEYVSIFKAWAYSIAVGENNSRQEMWLYGNGGTGKSCLCKAFIKGFSNLAGKDICLAASKDTGKSNFNSEILNKHLLVYPDAKNLKGGMSEFKHNATGGDYMRIEGKCKAATSAFVYLKCLTCSNELPKVDMTDRSQSSRYIVLPFTLDDDEMKQYGLMDESGQMRGSSTFQSKLDAEFNCFLASCKEHYEHRCTTNSNIDAHEALDELSAIEMDEIAIVEDFIDSYYEVTNDPSDWVLQKDFRKQWAFGIEDADEETGVKVFKSVDHEDVQNYLEKKYSFKWKVVKIKGVTCRAVTSSTFGIKLKSCNSTVTTEPVQSVFDD